MSGKGSNSTGLKKPGTARRREVTLTERELISIGCLNEDRGLPWVIQPMIRNISLIEWGRTNGELIHSLLLKHGAILFRGFDPGTALDLEHFVEATSREWAAYREPATPRQQVSENIFTSTEYPAEQTIFLHNENSHCDSWPARIYFLCITPPSSGGETPIADCRRVFKRIDPAIKRGFLTKKILYIRNFGGGLGFPWQTVFGTSNRAEVESYCRQHQMRVKWREGDRLRVEYIRDAVATHPTTGESVWFNHGVFFNCSTLDPEVRKQLLAQFEPEDLPYNTYYGDGSQIDPSVMDELRSAYREETVSFPYRAGDLLMLDNMLVAHGRSPFEGNRRVLVGMSDPVKSIDATFKGE
jgi:alpha-ketoglutarate-dependent taurine dioxygenase